MASAMPLMVLVEVPLLLMELQEVEETDHLDLSMALTTATRICHRLLTTNQAILLESSEVLLLLSAGESEVLACIERISIKQVRRNKTYMREVPAGLRTIRVSEEYESSVVSRASSWFIIFAGSLRFFVKSLQKKKQKQKFQFSIFSFIPRVKIF